MLKILFRTHMFVPTTSLTPANWLWPTTLAHCFLIALTSLTWLTNLSETRWYCFNNYLATDGLSTSLLVLSCCLLPLMILASENDTTSEPIIRQRLKITLQTSVQFYLFQAFRATDVIIFSDTLEASLIPALIMITRWGIQSEPLNARTYFRLYSLAGCLPLVVAQLFLQINTASLSLLTLLYCKPMPHSSYGDMLWCARCLMAILVKLPQYGVDLCLPKGHDESPLAGSLVVAAMLLNLGAFGLMWMMFLLGPLTKALSYAFFIFGLWGVSMSGCFWLRQTDVSWLMAYSSVSHIGLVAGGILTQSPWGYTGALTLLIAHRHWCSPLVCLGNSIYVRSHGRTMLLASGLEMVLALMATWCFIALLAYRAVPPLPILIGVVMIISSLWNWSWWTLGVTGAASLITAGYSLNMFLLSQRGPDPGQIIGLEPCHSGELLLTLLHMLALFVHILKLVVIWAWSA
uniref:NADH-ubiquinone oxidoreductase chain 4 n=1 Tax=Selaroides leptolepis TaxID=173311 RepID=A0A109WVK9_SELLE|nr:NADH dehydrogenase subunit 4 [Selaroides leptolepis]